MGEAPPRVTLTPSGSILSLDSTRDPRAGQLRMECAEKLLEGQGAAWLLGPGLGFLCGWPDVVVIVTTMRLLENSGGQQWELWLACQGQAWPAGYGD